ncbi:MAG TPA: Fur family transcriptional regulator [Thermoplasmataceae archaeon]|nr:transcriptional repressor [Thermoplasmatales archaeon AK]HLH86638.1 Fur family transcriptional regulator [Thermoplasmataceae archaeon]
METAYVDALKKSGFKITPQRLRVIDFVKKNTPGHFTAEDVYVSVKRHEPSITLATVYNILKTLQVTGTVKSFEAKGTTWFETNTALHGNMVCENCGKIYDVSIDDLDILPKLRGQGYDIRDVNLILTGRCPECRSD